MLHLIAIAQAATLQALADDKRLTGREMVWRWLEPTPTTFVRQSLCGLAFMPPQTDRGRIAKAFHFGRLYGQNAGHAPAERCQHCEMLLRMALANGLVLFSLRWHTPLHNDFVIDRAAVMEKLNETDRAALPSDV